MTEAPDYTDFAKRGLVRYPIRLDGDTFAYLSLPVNLTQRDVRRITAYMESLLLPPAPAQETERGR
jgi:hypothetical protein